MDPHSGYLSNISICSGGAGLDLGFELAIPRSRSVLLAEREAFACATLVAAMQAGFLAEAPIWSDVRTLDGRPWRGLVDGVIGGIPCQPHSLAGRKRGKLDDRDLWSPTRRIIVQARPWYVLIENVGGMLSAGHDEVAGAERVYRDLRKLGFTVEGGLFTAEESGAPHQRERIFILGVADAYFSGCGGEGDEGQPSAFLDKAIGAMADGDGEPGWKQYEFAGGEGARERQQSHRGGEPMAFSAGEGWEGSAGRIETGEFATIERIREGMGDTSSLRRKVVADRIGPAGQHVRALDWATGRDGYGSGAEGDLSDWGAGAAQAWFRPLFPPGPHDADRWRDVIERTPEFEPAFRRVADGLAFRMDASRVDRLRMLGNGVLPIQAGYAIRTLGHRLAARGSRAAIELVRLMGVA